SASRHKSTLKPLALAGDVEEYLAVRALHHEEQEVAPLIGGDLRDAQRLVVAEAALARLEQILGGEARDADRVGDVGGEPAFAPVALQPSGDAAKPAALEREHALRLQRCRSGKYLRRKKQKQPGECGASGP